MTGELYAYTCEHVGELEVALDDHCAIEANLRDIDPHVSIGASSTTRNANSAKRRDGRRSCMIHERAESSVKGVWRALGLPVN